MAIIIAGDSLIHIETDPTVKQVLLTCSDQVDVLLACRVSPKQKADIVEMVKLAHP